VNKKKCEKKQPTVYKKEIERTKKDENVKIGGTLTNKRGKTRRRTI